MIRFQFFPRSRGTNEQINNVINCFKSVEDKIDSETNNLVSNDVLAAVRPYLEKQGFKGRSGQEK